MMRNPFGAFAKDRDIFKIVMFASILIFTSITGISFSVYWFSEKEVVKKLQEKDLVYIAQSISGQVDSRIDRAKETSRTLAIDPAVETWLTGGEQDAELGGLVKDRLRSLARDFDYNNSFIVSNTTMQYWAENGEVIDIVSEEDPDDSWFYTFLHSGNRVRVDVDYNDERQDTFVFLNALVGTPDRPLGVAGVGLSLKTISNDFEQYKYGDNSNLWIVNGSGEIVMASDVAHNGKPLESYVPAAIRDKWEEFRFYPNAVLDYEADNGSHKDLIIYPLKSASLWLIYEIDREETVSFLGTLRLNTIGIAALAIVVIILLFFFISYRLANPYRRALELNMQLEQEVGKRTAELSQRNDEITDSINYAKRIQQSLLPAAEQLHSVLPGAALHWRPRDIVGGDFYWAKATERGRWIAVGDCTGHGVPGAFMTMLIMSLLSQTPELDEEVDPGTVLTRIHVRLKRMLHQQEPGGLTEDGLDLALCFVDDRAVRFAGAGMSLYYLGEQGANRIKGDRKGIGYRRTDDRHLFSSSELKREDAVRLFFVTDGWLDQPGGPKGYSFGQTRFLRMLERWGDLPLDEQVARMVEAFDEYQGQEDQRDDVTLLALPIGEDVERRAKA